jgi:GT2 family glycosyltransferase
MSGLSVIIPSRNTANLVPCVEAIRKHEPDVRIIVIDDGLDHISLLNAHVLSPDDVMLSGMKPFIFSRNCNLGIRVTGDDDVILCNDDALLESPNGFSAMQRAAQEHPEYGIISATTNLAGNMAQHRTRVVPYITPNDKELQRVQGGGIAGAGGRGGLLSPRTCPSPTPGNSFATVAFVCVLIPRRTIEAVGLLDERFGGVTAEGKQIYGWEDNDYCRRVNNAGLKIGIHDGCYVDHAKLTSSFRGMPTAAGDINAGRKIYLDKWGSM